MLPLFKALAFGLMTLIAAWTIFVAVATGVARDRGRRYDINQQPFGYLAVVVARAVVMAFGMTEVLSSFGLAADPVVALQHVLPAFLSHSHS